jgi:hypothetical protein
VRGVLFVPDFAPAKVFPVLYPAFALDVRGGFAFHALVRNAKFHQSAWGLVGGSLATERSQR